MRIPSIIWRLGAAPAVLVASMALIGCAGDAPTHEIAHAKDTITRAQEDGAAKLAPDPLQLSQDKLAKATAASEKGDYDQARRLAEEAEADADYASASARAAQAESTARELQNPQAIQHRQTRTLR